MSKMCKIKMTETLNYSITIHGAYKPITIIWSLLKLFYFTALQVDHTHDEKKHSSIVWRTVENIGNADKILKL